MDDNDKIVVYQDVIADGRKTPVVMQINRKFSGHKSLVLDKCVVEHYHADTGKTTRHECNSGFWHKIKVKLGLEHNSLNAQGIADIAQWIGGLSSPTAYAYLGIGTETSVDTQTDTY